MGLDVVAKGMPNFRLAYSTYYRMRMLIIKEAYGDRCEEIFRKQYASDEDIAYWNSVCNDDLDLFLLHSDCDGKFTAKECKRIYKALEPIHIDREGWGFDRADRCNMLDQWKRMFKHCMDKRVNMYYE